LAGTEPSKCTLPKPNRLATSDSSGLACDPGADTAGASGLQDTPAHTVAIILLACSAGHRQQTRPLQGMDLEAVWISPVEKKNIDNDTLLGGVSRVNGLARS